MANEVIGIDVKVSLEQLRQQLATLGPGMQKEAAAMTAELNKQLKAQVAATRAATAAMTAAQHSAVKQAGDTAETAATKFDKLAKAAGPLGGVLARVSPQAGAMAATLAGLTSTAEGVAAGLGTTMAGGVAALSAVIGPAVIALGLLAANMQYEAAQAEASEAAHKALNEAIKYTEELASGTADAMLDLKVKVGQIAPEDAAFEKALRGVTAEYQKQNAAIEKAIATRIKAGGAWGVEVKALRDTQKENRKLVDERVLLLEADREWSAEVRKSEEFIAERDKATAEAAAKAAKAAKAAAAAEEEANEAAKAATEKTFASMKRLDDHREAAAQKDIARKKRMAELDAHAEAYVSQLVQDNLDARVKAAEEAEQAMEAIAVSARDTVGNVIASLHTVAGLAADAAGEAADRSASRLERIRGLLADLTSESVDASTLTGDALVRAYKRGEVGVDELTEAQRESIASVLSEQEEAAAKRSRADRMAARAAWQTQQGLNIAQTFAAGAVALIQAFAQLGPVAGAIAGIGIAAATAASIATITSQKPAFHSGGVVGGSANGQGEVSARLLPQEAVLNRQATANLGAGGVAALNSGAGMGAVSLRIGRLEAREIVRTDIAGGGLIARTAKSAAASAGNTAGRTGRRPIA